MFPGAWIVFAIWALQRDDAIRTAAEPYALYFCFGALAAAALISWYYDSTRLLAAAIAVAGVAWLVQSLPLTATAALWSGSLLLAIDFAFLAALRERGVTTIKGALTLMVIAAPLAAAIFLAAPERWSAPLPLWAMNAQAAAFLATAVTILVFVWRRRTKVEHGLFWSFVALAVAALTGTTQSVLIYGGAAGLILMFAVLEHGHDIAYLDELTGLPGRRAFNQSLTRLGKKYCIAMCDVDHFKRFNDTHGHDAGDQALRMVAARLAEVAGGGEAFRYGGEEFVLVFRNHSLAETRPHLEALRRSIAEEPFIVRSADRSVVHALTKKMVSTDTHVTALTVSLGLAERTDRLTSPELVLEFADNALYRAKALGRNRVVAAGDAESAATT